MKNRLLNKKLKSLAVGCLASHDALSDTRDLLEYYDADLKSFMRDFLISYMGFSEKKADIKTSPTQRKTGERPKKPQRNKPKEIKSVEQQEEAPTIQPKVEPSREPWEKKLYKKVMMEVHPDRLDLVSKNSRDRYQRIEFEDRIKRDPSPEILLAIAIQLEIDIELDVAKQRRMLNAYTNSSSAKIKEKQALIGWSWGEFVEEPEFRLGIVKKILMSNNLAPPADETILAALLDYN